MSKYCQVTGKLKHASPGNAAKATGGKGSVYKCPHCSEYHHTLFIDGYQRKKYLSKKRERKHEQ